MNKSHVAYSAATLALLAVVGASVSIGGPLNPPPGPITSTYKTLTEIEPRTLINSTNTPGDLTSVYTISQPGSYYLGADVLGAAGKNGIAVTTDNVTIDLNGFQVIGAADSLKGVCITATGARAVTIRNGTVRNWGSDGVCTSNVSGSEIIQVRAWSNAGFGIDGGPSAIIKNCTAQTNAEGGFNVGNNGVVAECSAQQCGGVGFTLANGCTMTGSTSGNNTQEGVIAGTGCTLTSCTARANGSDGFRLDFGCTVSECSASFSARDGFSAVGSGITIRASTAEANSRDGIRANADCLISGNSCDSNGYNGGDGANIHTLGTHNRIEGNNATDADRGIQVDGAHSLVIRNTASNNGVNFQLAPNNLAGAIVTTQADLLAANGNANVTF